MSEQPRVLFCCFDVVPGPHAQSRRLTEYIKGLGDRFQVVVLSVKTADNSHIQRYHGARLLRVPVGSGDLPDRVQAFDRAVRRQLESEEYLLVHFFDPFGGYALCERRAELGYRVIYDACTFPSVEMPLASPEIDADRKFIARMRRQELFCLMNADSVVVGSEIAKSYVTDLGVPAPRVTILRAPVDLTPFTPEVMGRPDSMPMRLIHLGSENPWTGLSTLIEAMSLIAKASAHLSIIGPKHAEQHAKLVDQIAALKLEKQVEFQEPIAHDDIHKVLATTDVGLVTMSAVDRNRSPGGPLARLGEYLAAGRPVIAADLPLARELVPAEAAIFYPPDDATALATAITELANDPGRRLAMGAAARIAAQAWDASSTRGSLLDLYSTLAGPVAAPSPDDEATKVPSGGGEQISDAVTQLGARPFTGDDSGKSADPGANRVKTDPAIALLEGATDPQSVGGRPPVMGTLLNDEPPVVVGEMLPATREARAELALNAVTDLEKQEQPVVMGQPVWLNEPGSEGALESVPWVDAPSPLPDTAQSLVRRPGEPDRLYPFTPGDGSPSISRSTVPMGEATPKAPMPAHVARSQHVPSLEESSVIVDDTLFDAGAGQPQRHFELADDESKTPTRSAGAREDGFSAPTPLQVEAIREPAPQPPPLPAQRQTAPPAIPPLDPEPKTISVSDELQTGPWPDLMAPRVPAMETTVSDAANAAPAVTFSAADEEPPTATEHTPTGTDPDHTPVPSDGGRAAAAQRKRTDPDHTSVPSDGGHAEAAERKRTATTDPDRPVLQGPRSPAHGVRKATPALGSPRARHSPARGVRAATAAAPPDEAAAALPPRSSREAEALIRQAHQERFGERPLGAEPLQPSGAQVGLGRQTESEPPPPSTLQLSSSTRLGPGPSSSPSGLSSSPSFAGQPGFGQASSPSSIRTSPSGLRPLPAPPPSAQPLAKLGSAPPTLPSTRVAPPSLPLRSSPSSVFSAVPPRSSDSGILAAPANALSGYPLPPISAPPRPYAGHPSPPPLPQKKPKPAPPPVKEEVEEVFSDDVISLTDEPFEAEGASNDEVMEADGLSVEPTPDEVSLPPSALDPWLAQLVHGYCPPESQLFARHVPPTTMPGRD